MEFFILETLDRVGKMEPGGGKRVRVCRTHSLSFLYLGRREEERRKMFPLTSLIEEKRGLPLKGREAK